MAFKIGQVYRITNRYLEIIHNKDIFSKPVSSGNGLYIVGMLNSYVSIPLYNSQNAIGVIFEQLEQTKEREALFNPKTEAIISKIRLIGTYSPLSKNFKKGVDYFPTLDSNVYYIDKLAREGRKFGVNLMVPTQRPSEVSNTVISQCNSLIVHKITNNRDLEFIRNTIEYEDKSQIDLLTSLKQQQALVLGEAFAFSSLIRIAEADPLPHSETPEIFINETKKK